MWYFEFYRAARTTEDAAELAELEDFNDELNENL